MKFQRFSLFRPDIIAAVLVLACFPFMWMGEICRGFAISVFAGTACWVACVRIPEFRTRRILKKRLSEDYAECKKGILRTVLYVANFPPFQYDVEKLAVELQDPKKFRDFFNADNSQNWNDSFGKWTSDTVTDVLFYVNELGRTIEEVLSKNYEFNNEAEAKLRHLCRFWRQIQTLSVYQGDLIKYVGEHLVWPLMANCSIVSGQFEKDWIQEAIDSL